MFGDIVQHWFGKRALARPWNGIAATPLLVDVKFNRAGGQWHEGGQVTIVRSHPGLYLGGVVSLSFVLNVRASCYEKESLAFVFVIKEESVFLLVVLFVIDIIKYHVV